MAGLTRQQLLAEMQAGAKLVGACLDNTHFQNVKGYGS